MGDDLTLDQETSALVDAITSEIEACSDEFRVLLRYFNALGCVVASLTESDDDGELALALGRCERVMTDALDKVAAAGTLDNAETMLLLVGMCLSQLYRMQDASKEKVARS